MAISGLAALSWQAVLANNAVLECYTALQNQPKNNFSITMSEQKRQVVHHSSSGVITTNAIINNHQISYPYIQKEPFGMQAYHSYTIDKATLKVVEAITTNSAAMNRDKTVIALGSCK